MDYPNKQFVVEFDPKKVKVEQLIDTVKKAGYKPRRESAVTASSTVDGVKLEAATKDASLKKGKDGALTVKLAPPSGEEVSGLSVEVAAEKGLELAEAKGEAKPGEKEVVVPLKATKAGQGEATVVVRWQQKGAAKEVRLALPVYVE